MRDRKDTPAPGESVDCEESSAKRQERKQHESENQDQALEETFPRQRSGVSLRACQGPGVT